MSRGLSRATLVGASALVVVIVSCGGPGADPTHPVVEMHDNRFDPVIVTVPAGGTVTFAGAGRNPHNAVAADGSWSTEATFGGLEQFEGDVATISVSEPGSYPFFCTLHGNAEGEGMAGTLIVVPSSDQTPRQP